MINDYFDLEGGIDNVRVLDPAGQCLEAAKALGKVRGVPRSSTAPISADARKATSTGF